MESKGEIIIYKKPGGEASIEVKLEEETLWLSQKLMANLFDKDADTIGLHLKNIYSEGELEEKATTEFYSVVQKEGKRIADNALVALTLLIAQSKPEEKDMMVKVIVNLINSKN